MSKSNNAWTVHRNLDRDGKHPISKYDSSQHKGEQLFEPEEDEPIHPGVIEVSYNLWNYWLQEDNDILMTKYDRFILD